MLPKSPEQTLGGAILHPEDTAKEVVGEIKGVGKFAENAVSFGEKYSQASAGERGTMAASILNGLLFFGATDGDGIALELGEEGAKVSVIKGGSYREVRNANTGGEVHHMPANSVSPVSHGKGPAIWMIKEDHFRTASHPRQGVKSARFRAHQKQLIIDGRPRDALALDIKDIRVKFGSLYNKSLLQMINYAKINELFAKDALVEDGNRLNI